VNQQGVKGVIHGNRGRLGHSQFSYEKSHNLRPLRRGNELQLIGVETGNR
jgi:hypothetical protein